MFHVELAPLGGIFGPPKSDLGVFWPFPGTDFIMGKNQNANSSKRVRCPILKFLVVIREVILQKMAPILPPVIFFFGFQPYKSLWFSYRKAVIRPQNMPKTSDWGVCGARGFPNGRPEIKQCKIGS